MKYETAVEFYGKATKIAKALQISRAAVAYWKRSGVVPIDRARQIEAMTGGHLKVDESVYANGRGNGGANAHP